MNKQDSDLQAIYCAWAEQKYGLGTVHEVRFDVGHNGPYSEVTPDIDTYVSVEIKTDEGWVDREEDYLADVMADVTRFAWRRAGSEEG